MPWYNGLREQLVDTVSKYDTRMTHGRTMHQIKEIASNNRKFVKASRYAASVEFHFTSSEFRPPLKDQVYSALVIEPIRRVLRHTAE